VDCYGQTECCDDVLHYTIPRSTDTSIVPIGTPSFNTRIFILNHHDQLQPMGLPGEICVSGAGVGNGYWNREELSREKFVDNPIFQGIKMYRTGDLGKWLPDGKVAYLGRLDHQVKVRGNRIELREIETVMAGHSDILEAAVVTKQDHHGETVLHAFFVANRDIGAAEIRQFLGQTLPDYMVPGFFTKLERMPQTPNMKIDRKKLKAMEGTIATGTAFKPPTNDTEKTIREIWRQLLGRDDIGVHDNFFDLGGHSLLLIKLKSRLEKSFGVEIQLVELFKYPTIALLGDFVDGEPEAAPEDDNPQVSIKGGDDVAVIGISIQVPGAMGINQFWTNIKEGIHSICNFSEEELESAPLSSMIGGNCALVPSGGVLGDVDLFDAAFFGYTPGEAEVMDPQQRLFLEYSWNALEDAGYGNTSQLGFPVGVYGGVGFNTYLLNNLMSRPDVVNRYGEFQIMIANDKDFLASRVAYKLDLKGPAVTVQSACSTSLVVVHMARQGLLQGDCRMALAGGVAVRVPERTGYFFTEGGHLSSDGICRAFSSDSNGTVFGNGIGVVVMKRLPEAEADGDHIYAVIKSSAINNDGSLKVGYTSPGEQGQAEVVRKALMAAAIDPETISYIETHGTGTVLGDPIEVSALTSAFRQYTEKKGFCAIGSVKPNIGHLDAAAGIVGLIKAVLCLKNRQIPPSIHVKDLNPNIDFDHSPFYVNRELKEWTNNGSPRRAACSSLGIGGTNAHVVLEEYPKRTANAMSRSRHIVALSAKSQTSLDRLTENLAAFFKRNRSQSLADIAYTLLLGRERFSHRKVCVLPKGADMPLDNPNLWQEAAATAESKPPVVFMFPGQGSQYTGMCRDLYDGEPVFRREMDCCFDILQSMNVDLRHVLYPPEDNPETAAAITDTAMAQPLIFAVEYSLARLLMFWGVKPYCMVGHSIGEYTAACLAGVFTLEEALRLVAARGRLMGQMPAGAMLSVPLSEEEARPYLGTGVELAAVNSSELCVVSGKKEDIDACGKRLQEAGIDCRRLHTSHAFHSAMMEPVLRPFEEALAGIEMKSPRIPFFSNVTGDWAAEGDCLSPAYWARQLRSPVRFSAALDTMLAEDDAILLEVGPGNALGAFVRRHGKKRESHRVVELTRHPRKEAHDGQVLLEGLGRLWLAGVDIDWKHFYEGENRRRISLPVYPFDRKRHWLEPRQTPEPVEIRKSMDRWCYVPSWKQALPPGAVGGEARDTESPCVLLFSHGEPFKRAIGAELERRGCRVVEAEAAGLRSKDECRRLVQSLVERDVVLDKIVIAGDLEGLLYLIQTFAELRLFHPMEVWFVASGVFAFGPTEYGLPELAAVEGGLIVMGQEFANLSGRVLDIEVGDLAAGIVADEMLGSSGEGVVVYRGGQRWTRCFDLLELAGFDFSLLRSGGVYLVVGGLGRIGLAFGEFLAHYFDAKLVLVGRRPLDLTSGVDTVDTVDPVDPVDRIKRMGDGVLYFVADACDRLQMEAAFQAGEAEFGGVDGVVFAAGEMAGGFGAISELSFGDCLEHFSGRRLGLGVLSECVRERKLDFVFVVSSLSAVLGGVTLFGYSAAHCYLDAFCVAQSRSGEIPWICVDWPHWQFDGEDLGDPLSILPFEGVEVFKRILSLRGIPRVVVSTTDLNRRLEQWVDGSEEEELFERNRPGLSRRFVEPESVAEGVVADIWEEILGIHPVGVHDDFFELGGHSLLATKLAGRLREIFQIDVPIQVFFARPTVRQMLEYIEETWGDPGTVAEIARVYREVF
jgi:acyl transferase domain-containing protein/acyl carrier protein